MSSLGLLIRRGVAAVVVGVPVAAFAVWGADAKATDAVGQDPTAPYDNGRGASLRSDLSPPYIPGLGFDIGAEFKFKQR